MNLIVFKSLSTNILHLHFMPQNIPHSSANFQGYFYPSAEPIIWCPDTVPIGPKTSDNKEHRNGKLKC